MSCWNFSKPLLLFFLPICCPSLHCWDPTDPPALARKMETRKCAIFNTILFSTCLAQLTHSFCPESLWAFPIPTCCDLFLLKMRKSTFFFLIYMAKNLPAMQETQVWSLGWEDPLEEGMATHSSILVWRIPRTEEPGGLQFMGSQRVGLDWATHTHRWLINSIALVSGVWQWFS